MTNSDTAEIRTGKTVVVESPLHRRQPGSINPSMNATNPNAPPAGEAVAASFPSRSEADKVVADLAEAGISRDTIVTVDDTEQKREFLKGFVHQDSDRHTHSQVGSAFFALGGAFAFGLVGVLIATWSTQGWPTLIIGALVGSAIGAALGAFLGRFALRHADDRSMDLVDRLSKEGTLVAVRAPHGTSTGQLDPASRVLSRHNSQAFRLKDQVSQADLLPGDTRQKQA